MAVVVHHKFIHPSTMLLSLVAVNKNYVDINFHENRSTGSKSLNGHTQRAQQSKKPAFSSFY
jgi:hypothetical protein